MKPIFLTPREQASNFGLAVWYAPPHLMEQYHVHNDVEVNLITHGGMTYLHGGGVVAVEQSGLAVFWAARPHQVIEVQPDTWFHGFSVPFSWFLEWALPEPFVTQLLEGSLMFPPRADAVDALETLMWRWLDDMQEDTAERRKTMLLEMQSWFRRVALAMAAAPTAEGAARPLPDSQQALHKVERLAAYITAHYRDPLTIPQVAEAVGMHPNYAVNLFRQKTGSTLVDFLTKQRLAHAQLLLTTTDAPVLEVALEAGFGSLSRFYAVFKRAMNMAPKQYRSMMRAQRRQGRIEGG